MASPFTSSNGGNLQAIFTSGVKKRKGKTPSKRSATKQRESILKKKKIKKANNSVDKKNNGELETLRSSQVSKTFESKDRGNNKMKSIISIVEHNKRKAGPSHKKFAA